MGKGGTGKSSIGGTLCRHLARLDGSVLALDVDTMPGLAISLGAPAGEARLPAGVFEVSEGKWRLVRRTRPSRLIDRYSVVAPDGVRLLELGKLPGRVEPSVSVAFRWVMESFRRPGWAIVADLAAGTRQPMYRWARFASVVMVVAEPTAKSLMTARRLAPLATHLVANKVRSRADSAHIAASIELPLIASVPYDRNVVEADRQGVALLDLAPESPASSALEELARRLLENSP